MPGMWTSLCHKRTGHGTSASARVPVFQPVARRRSMMVSIGHRTPTNKTGNPLSSLAQSGGSPGDGVGVVVADVYDDIQPHAAVGGDGLIQRAVQGQNQ